MTKQIYFGEKARSKQLEGIRTLTKAVQVTLGPKGRNVMISKSYGEPIFTKDGVTVAKNIDLQDKAQDMGVKMLKYVCSKTADKAGDGTTTATVLTHKMVSVGMKGIVSGMNPIQVKRGMDKALKHVDSYLSRNAKTIVSFDIEADDMLERVASISANGDHVIGKLVAGAVKKVGDKGTVSVTEGNGFESELEVTDGMQFNQGYLSPYFQTSEDKSSVEFDNPHILVTDKNIINIRELVPLLEKISKSGRPCLLIAENVTGEALSSLVINNVRGTIRIVAVKAPGFGDNRKDRLADIATLTGAQLISEETGHKLDTTELHSCGSAVKVKITKHNTTIISGKGNSEDIKQRISLIEHKISDPTSSSFDIEQLNERLGSLSGGVALIKVGATTEAEMKEIKDRVEDALSATKAALEEGVVPGGGVALLRASEDLKTLDLDNEDENYGVQIVMQSLSEPLHQITSNAGISSGVVIHKILSNGNSSYGYNALNDSYGDMWEMGIVDPVKVTKVALQNSVGIAGIMLTTESLICEAETTKEDGGIKNPPVV